MVHSCVSKIIEAQERLTNLPQITSLVTISCKSENAGLLTISYILFIIFVPTVMSGTGYKFVILVCGGVKNEYKKEWMNE